MPIALGAMSTVEWSYKLQLPAGSALHLQL